MEPTFQSIPSMEKEQEMAITYHETAEISNQKAQELVRKVLQNTGGDVSKAAQILEISRPTVRRASDVPLEDLSRRRHHSPRRIESRFE